MILAVHKNMAAAGVRGTGSSNDTPPLGRGQREREERTREKQRLRGNMVSKRSGCDIHACGREREREREREVLSASPRSPGL